MPFRTCINKAFALISKRIAPFDMYENIFAHNKLQNKVVSKHFAHLHTEPMFICISDNGTNKAQAGAHALKVAAI
jgi:hypothetical protein